MPVRVSRCHKAVVDNHDRIALTRGPFVLCAEGVDNGGVTERFYFDKATTVGKYKVKTTKIDSGTFIQVSVPAQSITKDEETTNKELTLTPYYAWNIRGPSSMTVWYPTKKSLAVFDPHALPSESVFANIIASHTSDLDTLSAIGDGREPRWSSGKKVPRWTSRPQLGKNQWVEGRFHGPRKIRSIGVYWMNYHQLPVKFPKEWNLEVEQGGQWKPFQLYTTDRYGTRANQYNIVHPAAPVICSAIRINMTPKEESAVGILEVQVVFEK